MTGTKLQRNTMKDSTSGPLTPRAIRPETLNIARHEREPHGKRSIDVISPPRIIYATFDRAAPHEPQEGATQQLPWYTIVWMHDAAQLASHHGNVRVISAAFETAGGGTKAVTLTL